MARRAPRVVSNGTSLNSGDVLEPLLGTTYTVRNCLGKAFVAIIGDTFYVDEDFHDQMSGVVNDDAVSTNAGVLEQHTTASKPALLVTPLGPALTGSWRWCTVIIFSLSGTPSANSLPFSTLGVQRVIWTSLNN